MTALAVALALVAAALFAVSAVVQQRAASGVPNDAARGSGLIIRLVGLAVFVALARRIRRYPRTGQPTTAC
jgi:drug/metabolite transporter (DMT)-like permease